MSEAFLYYLWQFQYFDKHSLKTTEGEPIQIFNPGIRNGHAGPDFFGARIKIGDMEWVGSVEVHINASGWFDHNHHADPAYENVVLHVVWKSDKPVKRSDNTPLPTLELKHRINDQLLVKYKKLVNSPESIPCSRSFNSLSELTRVSALDKALLHRLEGKSQTVTETYQHCGNDWEETCYRMVCRNFGFKVNSDPFIQLAQSLPYKAILKHSDKLYQIEALLFGQAGFLDDNKKDSYYQLLQREYQLLAQKYQLRNKKLNKSQWRFLRLRPANFPTIRIAQLASLLHQQKNIFSKIIDSSTYKELRTIFSVEQSEYWLHNYQFGKPAKETISAIGEASVDNLIINTVVPLLAAYAKLKHEHEYIDRAVHVLQSIAAESNAITKKWTALGLPVKTAFDSQAIIELYNNFCMRRKCLECNIGASLLKPN